MRSSLNRPDYGKGHSLKIRLLTGVLALFLTFGFFPTAAQPSPLDLADQALFIGDYATAFAEYTRALSDPSMACPARYRLGITAMRAQQFNEADSYFTAFLNECEISFTALVRRGEVRQQMGRIEE